MSATHFKIRIWGIVLTIAIILCTLSLFLILVVKGYTLYLGLFTIKVENPIPWMIALLLALSLTYWLLYTQRIPSKKNPLLKLLHKADIYHFFLLGIFMVCLYFFHFHGGRIGSDGLTFYRWVWSFLFSGQPDPWSSELFTFKLRNIISPALLWFPFLLIGHFLAWFVTLFGRSIPLNGASYPYVNAVCLSSLLYAFVGIILLYELLKRYFSKRISFLSVVALWLGTFPLWYMIYQPSMPQCVSFFSVTLFIYVWFKTWSKRSVKGWIWLCFLAIVMIAVRPYNVVFLIFPLLEIAEKKLMLIRNKRWSVIKSTLLRDIVILVVTAASFYLLFYLIRGWMIIKSPYFFRWTQPKIAELLFSSFHGLLSWTPLIYLSLFGLPFMFKKDKRLFIYSLICLIVLIYILGSVTDWYAGDSYGSRRFTGALFIFAFAFAALIERIKKHPYLLIVIIIGYFLVGNMLFMAQYNKGKIPHLDTISFNRTAQEKISAFNQRFGYPFSFPANLWFRLKYGVPLERFDRVFGHKPYHNLSIDIGSQQDEPFIGKGWYGKESYEGLFSFRWSRGRESNILLSLFDAFDYRLEFKAAPFSYPGSPAQSITVLVNGKRISRIQLDRGFNSYSLLVPQSNWKAGLNEMKFHYEFYQQPKNVLESDDERLLGVAFDYVTLQIVK